MKLDYTHTYAATPERVVALLRNPEFIDDVARHAGALEHEVTIDDDATRLMMKLPVPSHLTKFVEVDVPGMPVDVNAVAQMRPTAEGTTAHYGGDLKVKIPLVGKKVEAQIEPFIRDAFDGLERRAADWLSR